MHACKELWNRMEHTLACCGLDPDWPKIPNELKSLGRSREDTIFEFLSKIIDVAASHVCAFKLQKAFFDLREGGHKLMREIVGYIHKNHAGIPVIVDCKIGDIDNTMTAYIENVFGLIEADGIIVNPYMGDEVVEPFKEYPDKAVAVLVRTSNPGSKVIQEARLDNGKALWEYILHLTVHRWNQAGNLIPVISSKANLDMSLVRQQIPDEVAVLLAGIGDQGGVYDGIEDLLNSRKSGIFVNSSRGVLYPKKISGENWKSASEREIISLKTRLNKVRESR